MPRRGPAYPIDAAWKRAARARIAELIERGDLDSQNDLARRAGVSKSSLSETFAADSVQSTVLPQLHRALGWPPPLLCPPTYVLELVELFVALPERQQGEWIERIRQAVADARRRS